MEAKSLNESIIAIRTKLQSKTLKKSGKNSYAGFNYYELADFLPTLNQLEQEEGVNDCFTIENDEAILTLIKGKEKQEYKMPFKIFDTPVNTKYNKTTGETREVKSMQDIQYLGALNTYYKRYLYINAFGITDGDIIDGMDSGNIPAKPKTNAKVKERIPAAAPVQEPSATQEPIYKINYAQKLIDYAKSNGIPMNVLAKKYNLNGSTSQEQFHAVLSMLESGANDAK